MSLPNTIGEFVDNHGNTLQNLALLAYLNKGEEAKDFLQLTTGALVLRDVHRRLTAPDAIDLAREETVANITKWIKEHPRARPSEIQHKIEEEVNAFKAKIKKLS